jgi:hypothetical protein
MKFINCRLIKDLVVIIVSATGGGIIFSCMGQPVSNSEILMYETAPILSRHDLCYSSRLLATYLLVL